MEGMPGDWIFIDWADGLSKKGEVSFEQLLLCRSLETMVLCADIANVKTDAVKYKQYATELRKKLFDLYWNQTKQALVHSRVEGKQTENVTRYANMFAIFYDYFNQQQKEVVKKSVLLNNNIQQITNQPTHADGYALDVAGDSEHLATGVVIAGVLEQPRHAEPNTAKLVA